MSKNPDDLDTLIKTNYKLYWSKEPIILEPNNSCNSIGGNGGSSTRLFRFNQRKLLILLTVLIVICLIKIVLNSHHEQLHHHLPSAIIIGARKCGTRALLDMLNIHPKVQKAPTEIHFFDRDSNYNLGLNWYTRQFPPTTTDQIAIEKSPSYYITPEVPERIHAMNASIKLLLIVRDPVTRLVSDYTQVYSNSNTSFESLVISNGSTVNTNYKAVRISIYSRYFTRWLDLFGLDQIHIVDGEALVQNPYSVLYRVEEFLGIGHLLKQDQFYYNATKGFYCWIDSGLEHCLNESKGRRHPTIDTGVLGLLKEFYKPYNELFYEMVGKEFGW